MIKNIRRALKNILFLLSFFLLSLQPIFCAKPANSLILKTDLILDAKSVDEFRKDLGGQLKKEIYRIIDQYPALKKKYKRSAQGQPKNPDEISVYPVQPHFTVLMLGDIAPTPEQQSCIAQYVQVFLDASINAAKKFDITNALPLVFIPGQQEDKEVSYIGIDLTKIIGTGWEIHFKRLHDIIEKKCGLKLTHYKTYQKHQWFPHITLFRINARKVLQTADIRTGQTLLESIQQILAQQKGTVMLGELDLGKMSLYNGKTLMQEFEVAALAKQSKEPIVGAGAAAAGAGAGAAGAYHAAQHTHIKDYADQGKPKKTKTLEEFQEALTDTEICSSREDAHCGKILWDTYHALIPANRQQADKLMSPKSIKDFEQYK